MLLDRARLSSGSYSARVVPDCLGLESGPRSSWSCSASRTWPQKGVDASAIWVERPTRSAREMACPRWKRGRSGRLVALPSRQDKFPDSVLGRALDGWPGERWLDIRGIGVLAPIVKARIAKCTRKGSTPSSPTTSTAIRTRAVSRSREFAIAEECFQYRECGKAAPFIDAGKPVLEVEYKVDRADFCPKTLALGFAR